MTKVLHYCNIFEIITLLTHANTQIYLISNDVLWYHDTFGVMH